MIDRDLYLYKLQNQFDYLYEIIRGDYFLKNESEGIYFLLKLIFLRLKSETGDRYRYSWKKIVAQTPLWFERIEEIDQLIREVIENTDSFRANSLSRIGMNKNLKSQTLYTIEEIIRFLDNLYIGNEINDRRLLADLFYQVALNLLSLKRDNYNDYLNDGNVAKIFSSIVQLEADDRIFDPFIGIGGLVFKSLSGMEYYNTNKMEFIGKDINPYFLEICLMLFNLIDINNLRLHHEDSIIDINHIYKRYNSRIDKIITHIPNNLHTVRYYDHYLSNIYREHGVNNYRNNMNFVIIESVLDLLNSNGKAYIIVPNNVLFSGGKDKEVRKRIIDSDLIEAVIEFSEYRPFKGIKPAIIVLNKKKDFHKKNKIFLVNVQDNDAEKIIITYKKYIETDISRIVSIDTVTNRGYYLNFSHYDPIYNEVKLMIVQEIGIYLRDIIDITKPKIGTIHSTSSSSGIAYIKQSNLKRDSNEVYLDINNENEFDYIECDEDNKFIDEKAIIIAIQGKDLKPTIFDPHKSKIKKIVLANGCLALVPRYDINEAINIEYLYYQLYNPRVIRQIDGLKRGIVKRITYNDLLNVVIPRHEYQKQLQYIKDQEEPLRELEKYKKLYEEISHKLEVEKVKAENRIVNMLIHNVGKHISVIGHDIQLIAKVIQEHDLSNFIYDKVEIEKYNASAEVRNGLLKMRELISVKEVYERTKDRLDLIEKTFTDTQKTVNLNLESNDFKKVNVKELILNIKRDRGLNQPISYDFIVDGDDAVFDINIQSFKEMIHLLINNAEEHAFNSIKNNDTENYFLKFNINKFKDRVVIQYTNNGSKFSMIKDDFILAGTKNKDSKGSGLGGAYLNRVVISHNGNFDIVDTETDYGTKFIFTFLLKR